MRYRKLDQYGDMSFGQQQSDYHRDVPEAPAQAVLTRLRLLQGEWYLDTSAGVPYQGGVLGKSTQLSADSVLRRTILETPGVTAIEEYTTIDNRDSRTYKVAATIETMYGSAVLNEVV